MIVRAQQVIARAYNQVEMLKDATAHAEMVALTQTEALRGDWRLTECTLHVTKDIARDFALRQAIGRVFLLLGTCYSSAV